MTAFYQVGPWNEPHQAAKYEGQSRVMPHSYHLSSSNIVAWHLENATFIVLDVVSDIDRAGVFARYLHYPSHPLCRGGTQHDRSFLAASSPASQDLIRGSKLSPLITPPSSSCTTKYGLLCLVFLLSIVQCLHNLLLRYALRSEVLWQAHITPKFLHHNVDPSASHYYAWIQCRNGVSTRQFKLFQGGHRPCMPQPGCP